MSSIVEQAVERAHQAELQAKTPVAEAEETTEAVPEAAPPPADEAPEIPETPAETETPVETEDKKDEKVSKGDETKFETFKKREKAIRKKESELKELETKYNEWAELQKLKDTDPLVFMERIGLNYSKLTDALLNGPDKEQVKMTSLEQRVAKFEEAEKQKTQEQEQARMRAEADEYIERLNEFVAGSDFDLIKATGSEQLVVNTIAEHYKETQEELEFEDACKLVEDYLYENEVKKIKKVMEVKKVKEKLGFNQPSATEEPSAKKTNKTKTLSNKNTSAVPERPAGKPLSAKEAHERAIKLEEEMKKRR